MELQTKQNKPTVSEAQAKQLADAAFAESQQLQKALSDLQHSQAGPNDIESLRQQLLEKCNAAGNRYVTNALIFMDWQHHRITGQFAKVV